MAQTRRTAQRAEIVPSGLDSDRNIVSGPATRWMPRNNIDFPIERLAGGDGYGDRRDMDFAVLSVDKSDSLYVHLSAGCVCCSIGCAGKVFKKWSNRRSIQLQAGQVFIGMGFLPWVFSTGPAFGPGSPVQEWAAVEAGLSH